MKVMKKRILTLVAAMLLVLAAVTPAFAEGVRGNSNKGGGMNGVEEELLGRFDDIMSKYKWFSQSHHDQYKAEARAALVDSRVDLDSAAKGKFNTALDQIEAILDTCNSDAEAWSHYSEIAGIVNGVSKSYHMTVSADAKDHYATVMIDGKVVASTKKVVRQTGFGLEQTAIVVVAAAGVLAGTFFVARKNKLFA